MGAACALGITGHQCVDMTAVRLSDEEWDVLVDEPAEYLKVYVAIKRRVDFSTGIAGLAIRLSEQTIREAMQVSARVGRKGERPSRKQVRYAVEALTRLGLLVPQSAHGPMVFYLPHGVMDQSVQNRWGQGGAKVGPEVGPQVGPDQLGNISRSDNGLHDDGGKGGATGGDVGVSDLLPRWGQPPVPGSGIPSPNGEESSEGTTIGDSTPPCPHQEIIELYHEILPTNPRVKVWNSTRKSYLRARWRERERCQDLDYWRRLFTFIRDECPFLTGRKEGTRGPFLPDLEWMVKPRNYAKIIEGQYREKKNVA